MTRPDLYDLVDRIPDSLLEGGGQLVGPDDLWTLSNVLVEFANWSADLWARGSSTALAVNTRRSTRSRPGRRPASPQARHVDAARRHVITVALLPVVLVSISHGCH
jgi:hypothetical protein